MDIFDEELIKFWTSLNTHGVKYIMVGGVATTLNGYTRFTEDIDMWIDDTLENRIKLRAAFKEYGLGDIELLLKINFIPGWTDFHLNNGLRLEFGSVDGGSANGLLVDITLTTAGGGASFVGIIPDNPNPQNYDVLFSAFATTPGFSFAAVTSVQLTFNNNGATNADFNLRRIEAQGNLVPEPGSIVLAVVGLIGCLAYVRRRSRV